MNKRKLFLIIGGFWFLIIAGFIGYKEYSLRTGTVVILETKPIDPRDLFRGDYVVLRYDLNSVDFNNIEHDKNSYQSGDSVFVSLKVVDSNVKPIKISSKIPDDKLYVKGTVKNTMGSSLIIEYGIESYFVEEGKGREIERKVGKDLKVQVSIDKFGNAIIKDLYIEGKKFGS